MKKILKFILLILLFISPFIVVFFVVEKTENQYKNTYLAELNDKYELLSNTNEKKIIFVGGSSLPFGLRSDLIEAELPEYKVVDYGLYATLGTKFMMDTSKVNINEGDIVILSPELSSQTYSLYFNPTAVLEACDGFTFKYRFLSASNNLDLFYNYYKFARNKMEYAQNNTAPNPIGIYRHDSFNQYGDILIDRPNNIMNNGVDSTMDINVEDLYNEDFFNYVNQYCDYVNRKKAKMYFNFSPCNDRAVISSKEKREEFNQKLFSELNCELLMNLEDCIMDYRYFYDTNFHLNSIGAIYYTTLLIENLKSKLGYKNMDTELPNPPSIDEPEVIEPDINTEKVSFDDYNGEPNNDYVDYFNYRLIGSSYQITSIKEEYKDIEKIILPSTYQGKNITVINADALYGCIHLKEIYIGLTYKQLDDKCFNGCINLEKIYLFAKDGNGIVPASSDLLYGTYKNIKIYIPKDSNYTTGYTWTKYLNYFVYFERG